MNFMPKEPLRARSLVGTISAGAMSGTWAVVDVDDRLFEAFKSLDALKMMRTTCETTGFGAQSEGPRVLQPAPSGAA